jgi:hypothetical protein
MTADASGDVLPPLHVDTGGWSLHSVVERDERGADRRTVYPVDVSEADICTHWFTANDGVFVDLASMR